MGMAETGKSCKFRKSRVIPAVVLLFAASCFGYYYVQFVVRSNFREVIPQEVYRSGQPEPAQLRQWIQEYGIRTVINLRGQTAELTSWEKSLADELGVELITFRISAYSLPARSELVGIIDSLEHCQLPVLIHCRHGVDRTGTVSALAAMICGQVSYDKAKWQAYVLPGSLKRRGNANHISDLFDLYERYCESHGLDTNDWSRFKYWSQNIYQPSYYQECDSNSLSDHAEVFEEPNMLGAYK